MPQFNTEGMKLRTNAYQSKPNGSATTTTTTKTQDDFSPLERTVSIEEAVGPPKHGVGMQLLRIIGFGIYFQTSCFFIHFAQLLGLPLYFLSKQWFYAYMAVTKQYFGLLVTTMTQWWSPTTVRISGNKSMKGLLRQNADGLLEVDFGERVILMANHQLYTDWLYLWWISYTNSTPMHGYIYIILKESLKWVPLIGPAMQLWGFVFMARKWSKDQNRLRYRLQKLNSQYTGPIEPIPGMQSPHLDPMWLMIFPEGTNLSANTRAQSGKFAAKQHIPDLRHQILPRSTGLQFCLQELKDTVPYIYDCTIAYEGIPRGGYGGNIFTLRSTYFQGRPPRSVNMHWRRFRVRDIPFDDADKMHEWVLARWREKDEMIEAFLKDGKFPADEEVVEIQGQQDPGEKDAGSDTTHINTEVKTKSLLEFLSMFVPVVAAALVGRVGVQIFDRIFGTGPLF